MNRTSLNWVDSVSGPQTNENGSSPLHGNVAHMAVSAVGLDQTTPDLKSNLAKEKKKQVCVSLCVCACGGWGSGEAEGAGGGGEGADGRGEAVVGGVGEGEEE